jgi:hypothetical protein
MNTSDAARKWDKQLISFVRRVLLSIPLYRVLDIQCNTVHFFKIGQRVAFGHSAGLLFFIVAAALAHFDGPRPAERA